MLKVNLAQANSILELINKLLVIFIILASLFWTGLIGGVLDKLGITKASIPGGYSIERKALIQTTDELAHAGGSITILNSQVNNDKETIAKQQAFIASLPPSYADAVKPLSDLAKTASDNIDSAVKSADTTAAALQMRSVENAPIIASAQDQAGVATHWGVIAGADTSERGARYDLGLLRNAGYSDAKLFQNRGAYHLVIQYSDRDAAYRAISGLPQRNRRVGAYLIDLNSWCRDRTEKPDLVVCVG